MKSGKDIEKAYRGARPGMLAWLRDRVSEEEAEDIIHDVIVRALASPDVLEPVRDLAAWFWRSVRNALIDAWRSRSRKAVPADLDDIVDGAFASAQDGIEREEIVNALRSAIAALEPGQREVVLAQSLGGETYESLSRRTGLPIETLAARKRRALARLAENMKEFA
jgi:RNA polymerase sigma factor (sigma-70 family)